MCIGSNWVNEAQDLKFVTKFEDLPNSLIPNVEDLPPLAVLSVLSPRGLEIQRHDVF